jgi:hypothetical protein
MPANIQTIANSGDDHLSFLLTGQDNLELKD